MLNVASGINYPGDPKLVYTGAFENDYLEYAEQFPELAPATINDLEQIIQKGLETLEQVNSSLNITNPDVSDAAFTRLSPDDRKEILEKISDGNQAFDVLFNCNLRLLLKVARESYQLLFSEIPSIEIGDLIQEGSIVLRDCILAWDLSKGDGTKFEFYIKRSLYNHYSRYGYSFNVFAKVKHKKQVEIVKAYEKIRNLDIPLDEIYERLSEKFGFSSIRESQIMVRRARRYLEQNKPLSLDEIAFGENSEYTSQIPTIPAPICKYSLDSLRDDITGILGKSMEPRTINMFLALYFGGDGYELSQKQVAKKYKVSRQRASGVNGKAIELLSKDKEFIEKYGKIYRGDF